MDIETITQFNLETLSRKDLQALAKKYGVKANMKNTEIIEAILEASQSVPYDASASEPIPEVTANQNVKTLSTRKISTLSISPATKPLATPTLSEKDKITIISQTPLPTVTANAISATPIEKVQEAIVVSLAKPVKEPELIQSSPVADKDGAPKAASTSTKNTITKAPRSLDEVKRLSTMFNSARKYKEEEVLRSAKIYRTKSMISMEAKNLISQCFSIEDEVESKKENETSQPTTKAVKTKEVTQSKTEQLSKAEKRELELEISSLTTLLMNLLDEDKELATVQASIRPSVRQILNHPHSISNKTVFLTRLNGVRRRKQLRDEINHVVDVLSQLEDQYISDE